LRPKPFDERNGWKLYQHPAFRSQFDALVDDVATLQATLAEEDFEHHPKVRLLARIRKLILEDIPTDPTSKAYEQGNTLGTDRRHWRRAKFNQRFRLFFRFRSAGKLIVYAWMNDENTLRARGARKDVYAVFGLA
jgi:toxin YhaV